MGRKRYYQVVICGTKDRATGLVTYDRIKCISFDNEAMVSSANDPNPLNVLSPNHDVYLCDYNNILYTSKLCIKDLRTGKTVYTNLKLDSDNPQWSTVSTQISPTQDLVCRAGVFYFDKEDNKQKSAVLETAGLGQVRFNSKQEEQEK